jgi:hypothetical protein
VTGSGQAAFVAAVVMGGLAVVAAFAWRSRLRGRPDLAVAVGVAVSMVCAPHVFPDDLMLLAVPAVVWAPLAPRAAVAGMLGLSVAYQLDSWLPSRFAHLTALAGLAVAVGVVMAVAGLRRGRGVGAVALPIRAGVEGVAPAP